MKKQILNEEFHRMQQLAGIKPLYEAYTGPKSKLEKIIQQAWGESDINAAKKLVIDFISPSKIKSKDQIINTIKGLTNKREFDRYMANALLKFEKLGLSEEQVNENSFGPGSNFQWKSSPTNPEDMVKDEEEGDTMTKAEFWKYNIIGRDPEETIPGYGTKQPDGTWSFTFDAGEFSGFVEGDDFIK